MHSRTIISTLSASLFPYTTLFRSAKVAAKRLYFAHIFCEKIRLVYRHRPSPSQKLEVSHGMPTRHLTDAQRQGFSRFDGEPSADQLARYFHLDQTDRDLIGTLRGDHNRLGFTVMLTSARFLGAFPVSLSEIPASVLDRKSHRLNSSH